MIMTVGLLFVYKANLFIRF